MEFPIYHRQELEEYGRSVHAHWWEDDPFAVCEPRPLPGEEQRDLWGRELMGIFISLGRLRDFAPDAPEVRQLVEHLHGFLEEHHPPCPPKRLRELGARLVEDERMEGSIDNAGGIGTARLARRAIEAYCRQHKE